MSTWLGLATQPSVVKRALKTALLVGTILVLINHGDAIVTGRVGLEQALKMMLTVVVPYLVSPFSSVGAIRDSQRA